MLNEFEIQVGSSFSGKRGVTWVFGGGGDACLYFRKAAEGLERL